MYGFHAQSKQGPILESYSFPNPLTEKDFPYNLDIRGPVLSRISGNDSKPLDVRVRGG